MATNRLSLEIQKYLIPIPQQIPTKGFSHSQNHTCLNPDINYGKFLRQRECSYYRRFLGLGEIKKGNRALYLFNHHFCN